MGVEDYFQWMRPTATDKQRLRVARILMAVVGAASAATVLILAHSTGGALKMWVAVSAIVSGGLAGLFLLAFLSRRANSYGVHVRIAASLATTVYAVLTNRRIVGLSSFNFTWDVFIIGAVGHFVLLVVGYVVGPFCVPSMFDSSGVKVPLTT